MVKGSRLCGEIHYEVELVPGKICNCHCAPAGRVHSTLSRIAGINRAFGGRNRWVSGSK